MSGRWIKIVIFVLLAMMAASVVTTMLDPGLGKPEESRRVRHLAGFSIVHPLGWGGTPFGDPTLDKGDFIRLTQERKTGRETTITVLCNGAEKPVYPNETPTEFQSQPASIAMRTGSGSAWQWRLMFEREGNWYTILIVAPIPLEVQKSAYWPFIESFRIEKQIVPTTQILVAPATQEAR